MSSEPIVDPVKPKLLALLREARAELQAWLDQLTEAERTAIGTLDSWSPKDILAHLTSWRRISLARLEAVRRGEQPQAAEDVQRHNDDNYERQRQLSWGAALIDSDQVFDAQFAAAEALSEAQLTDTSYPWLDGFPFWASVAGTFEHTLDHLVDYARAHGNWPRIDQLLDRQATSLLSLDGSAMMRAYVRYSQSGFWATVARPDRAIPLLREALTLDPKLIEDARGNASLDTLRGLPEFQALLATVDAAGPE